MGAEGAVSVETGWPGPGQHLHGCRVRGRTTAGSGGAGRGGELRGVPATSTDDASRVAAPESLNLGSAWSLTVPHSCSFLQ